LWCPGFRIDAVDFGGFGPNPAFVMAPRLIDVELDYQVNTPGCSNCRTQLLAIMQRGDPPFVYLAQCFYDDIPNSDTPITGSSVVTIQGIGDTADLRVIQTFDIDCTSAVQDL